MYKIGIDVGGTNTDAVLCGENHEILADVKRPTSDDIYSGILASLKDLLACSGVSPSEIRQATIGTTQCTNAIVERKNLAAFAVLRIGAPASTGIPPMIDWEEKLSRFCVGSDIIQGGYEFDGRTLSKFDETACRRFFESVKGKAESIAISCVFSTVRDEDERRAAAIAREILGDIPVSISSEIGSMGLIERENATILNAALCSVARKFTNSFEKSLKAEGITNADIYLSQNDGTLMTLENARRYPILTIACGPTNSICGAGWLSGTKNAMTIDVGGTTTDIGVIKNGFPRESSTAVTIGGVRTNFRMPDILSVGLGGGSIVRQYPDGTVTVGPDSVGFEITEKALVFGGSTITATDIAVRLGMAEIGDRTLTECIPLELAEKAMQEIRTIAEHAIDDMRVSSDEVELILVGGGSIILPDELSGASSVHKPAHFGVANAVGSAISQVSGTSEGLYDYSRVPREKALERARSEAVRIAVESGAQESTVEIIEVEETPLAYHPGNTSRIKVKAAGKLAAH